MSATADIIGVNMIMSVRMCPTTAARARELSPEERIQHPLRACNPLPQHGLATDCAAAVPCSSAAAWVEGVGSGAQPRRAELRLFAGSRA